MLEEVSSLRRIQIDTVRSVTDITDIIKKRIESTRPPPPEEKP